MHLVGAVGDAQRARALVHAGQRQVAGDAGRAPHLDRAVDDAVVGGGHEDLDRRDVGARRRRRPSIFSAQWIVISRAAWMSM